MVERIASSQEEITEDFVSINTDELNMETKEDYSKYSSGGRLGMVQLACDCEPLQKWVEFNVKSVSEKWA